MKTLLKIIIYLFPRRRWVTIETHAVNDYSFNPPIAKGKLFIQRDQFGNIRSTETCV